jgi:hypothetical protein
MRIRSRRYELTDLTFIELEFDTGTRGGALLGDIASSLVSVDELLRDLASIAAHASGAEFRNIEIVAIEMRSPLKIKLSLRGISTDAVTAFQDICRDLILMREGRSRAAAWTPEGLAAHLTDDEARRLSRHVANLQHAAIPLKRVEVKEA